MRMVALLKEKNKQILYLERKLDDAENEIRSLKADQGFMEE